MTNLEKVLKNKDLKTLLIRDYCPHNFDLVDTFEVCEALEEECKLCWNTEVKDVD